MANTTLTADIIAAEAIMVLNNNLGMASRVFRGHEAEYNKSINGFKVGDTVSIRRPTDFTVRDGPVASNQDVVEGKTTIVVDKQKGIDFKFTSADLTLEINEFSERIIMPAMVQLANQVDTDLLALYDDVWNWVGTPGQTINSFADYALAPERLSEGAVPLDSRSSMLSPADNWGLVGNQTGLFIDRAQTAYTMGTLGNVGGIATFESQNVQTHTNGDFAGTTLVDQALIDGTVTYAATKDTGVATIHIDGLTTATAELKAGDVFTIADVWAVNPVTKARKSFLQQFVLTADATAAANEVDLIVSPPPIFSGAFQTIDTDTSDLNNQAVTFLGTASTGYSQNMAFHRNAFALVSVPLERPAGAVSVTQKTFEGLSARLIPYYDGTNDMSNWRFDILYGVKTLDGRLATRISGTA